MKKTRILSMLLAGMMLFSMLAGCKREEATSSADPTKAPEPANSQPASTAGSPDVVSQGVTDDVVKIGTISLVSGGFAYIGQPAHDGMRAAIARLNAQGGVQGRQIEIVAYDDQFDAATGKATIERFGE